MKFVTSIETARYLLICNGRVSRSVSIVYNSIEWLIDPLPEKDSRSRPKILIIKFSELAL